MKSLIIYASHHHGNTQKLVQAIASQYPVDVLDAEAGGSAALWEYDLIGFASGIDFGKFYPAVTELAQALPAGKRIYALFTCAKDNAKYGSEIMEIAAMKNCIWLGKFGCRGYNTYGPWKLIGGMNKGHPAQEEIAQVLHFYQHILSQMF